MRFQSWTSPLQDNNQEHRLCLQEIDGKAVSEWKTILWGFLFCLFSLVLSKPEVPRIWGTPEQSVWLRHFFLQFRAHYIIKGSALVQEIVIICVRTVVQEDPGGWEQPIESSRQSTRRRHRVLKLLTILWYFFWQRINRSWEEDEHVRPAPAAQCSCTFHCHRWYWKFSAFYDMSAVLWDMAWHSSLLKMRFHTLAQQMNFFKCKVQAWCRGQRFLGVLQMHLIARRLLVETFWNILPLTTCQSARILSTWRSVHPPRMVNTRNASRNVSPSSTAVASLLSQANLMEVGPISALIDLSILLRSPIDTKVSAMTSRVLFSGSSGSSGSDDDGWANPDWIKRSRISRSTKTNKKPEKKAWLVHRTCGTSDFEVDAIAIEMYERKKFETGNTEKPVSCEKRGLQRAAKDRQRRSECNARREA